MPEIRFHFFAKHFFKFCNKFVAIENKKLELILSRKSNPVLAFGNCFLLQ